jgi:hypothetical protein
VEIAVDVENRTGHKLPTAYPSRRLWLHLKAVDATGRSVFESGGWDPATGDLRGALAAQPHRTRINSFGEVMIYEAEYIDLKGQPTTSLLRAARYSKDNRILPRGFNSNAHVAGIGGDRIGPVGTGTDPDFLPGGDRVIYRIAAPAGRYPASVTIEALYQSIKPARARATGEQNNVDAKQFRDLFQRHRDPAVLATLHLTVSGTR